MKGGTHLGRVRGLGSAKAGAHHWWNQRLTAGGNLALMTWFMLSLALLPGYDHATLARWLSSAWAAIPLILLVASVFWHLRLGLQVTIEDYESDESRVVFMVLLNFFVVAAAAVAVFGIVKLALLPGSAA